MRNNTNTGETSKNTEESGLARHDIRVTTAASVLGVLRGVGAGEGLTLRKAVMIPIAALAMLSITASIAAGLPTPVDVARAAFAPREDAADRGARSVGGPTAAAVELADSQTATNAVSPTLAVAQPAVPASAPASTQAPRAAAPPAPSAPAPKTAPTTTAAPAQRPPTPATAAPATTAAPRPAPTTTSAPTPTTQAAPATTAPPAPAPRRGTQTTDNAVMNINFEGSTVGQYTDTDVQKEWPAVEFARTYGRAEIKSEQAGQFMRIHYPRGGVGPQEGGSTWAIGLDQMGVPGEELYVSYRMRIPENFDYVLGGKLPGFAGGAQNGGGNTPNGYDGWTGRIMWGKGGEAKQYVYHPDQPGKYGHGMPWSRNFTTGSWMTIETKIRMNTPGQHDGYIQSWLDGQLVLDRQGMRFRNTSDFAIDNFRFETFFGGGTPDWAPSRDVFIDFDDFVISTSPITH